MMDSQRSFLLRGFSPLEGLDVFLLAKIDGLMASHTPLTGKYFRSEVATAQD